MKYLNKFLNTSTKLLQSKLYSIYCSCAAEYMPVKETYEAMKFDDLLFMEPAVYIRSCVSILEKYTVYLCHVKIHRFKGHNGRSIYEL